MTTPIERLMRPFLGGPMIADPSSKSNQFMGQTTLGSGQATVVVSTTVIGSDSFVQVTGQHTTVLSGFAGGLCVRSISPGNFMTLGWNDGLGRAWDSTLMWEVKKGS
jgi:hypothetical protein